MRIGIISMQRVINFGSYLQSYALKKILEGIACDVEFVDIKPGRQIVEKKSYASGGKKIDRFLLKRIEHVMFEKKRRKLFIESYFPELGVTAPVEESECDAVIVGSDEVFNCLQPSRWGFSTQLFGDTAVLSASYAASCGYTTYDAVEKAGITKEINDSLSKMVSISVRDANTKDFVVSILGKIPVQHLDPVLVYTWDEIGNQKIRLKDYILIYAYDNRISDQVEIDTIRRFAKSQGKILVSCGVYQRWCDKNIHCTPLELIRYFDGADYVITDTFHGTVISIKRNKKFATIIRETNRNKISDLLSRFSLQEREVGTISELGDIIVKDIEYDRVNDVLQDERERSISYLKDFTKYVREVKHDKCR